MIINDTIERLSKSKAEQKWNQYGIDFPKKRNENIKKNKDKRNSRSVSPNKRINPKRYMQNQDIFDSNMDNVKSVHFDKS